MYIDLQPDTRTRRDRKALARKLHRDLVRTGYSNPEMAAWDVARGVVRTMRLLNQHWYRHSLGFMSQEDSLAARLYIRHRLAHSLQVAPVLAEVVAGPTVAQLVMQLEQHTQQIQDLIQRMDQVNPQFGKPT